jgi:Rrf2 family protein
MRLADAGGGILTAKAIADQLQTSLGSLEHTLAALGRAGIITAKRGGRGGYRLVRPSDEVTVADVTNALKPPVEKPDLRSGQPSVGPEVQTLDTLWLAFEVNAQEFLNAVTIADLTDGELPAWAVQLAHRGRSGTGFG